MRLPSLATLIGMTLVSGLIVFQNPVPTSAQDDSFQLQKLSEHFSKESGFSVVTGEVRNISSGPLKEVEAVTTFYDRQGGVIKVDSALIEYNPVMPGQISPYKTITTDNPLITKEVTTFKYLMGGMIATRLPLSRKEQREQQREKAFLDREYREGQQAEKNNPDLLAVKLKRNIRLSKYVSWSHYSADDGFAIVMTTAFVRLPRQQQHSVEKQIETLWHSPAAFCYFAPNGSTVIDGGS